MSSLPMVSGGGGGYEVILNNTSMSAPNGVLVGTVMNLNKGIYFLNSQLYPYYSSVCNVYNFPSNANVNIIYQRTVSDTYVPSGKSAYIYSNPVQHITLFEVTADNTSVDMKCCMNGYSREGTLYEYLVKCG